MGRKPITEHDRQQWVEFGQWLREMRLSHQPRLTIEAAAQRAQITLHHFSKIEKGTTGTKPATVGRLALAVGADVATAYKKAGFPVPEHICPGIYSTPNIAAGAPSQNPPNVSVSPSSISTPDDKATPAYGNAATLNGEEWPEQHDASQQKAEQERLVQQLLPYLEKAMQNYLEEHPLPRAATLSAPATKTERDKLTGLLTRTSFERCIQREFIRAERNHHPLSLCILDIDQLKQYNTQFGHRAGDALLRDISQMLDKDTRIYDFAARLGGDEFGVILPNMKEAALMEEVALYVADRLRKRIAKAEWNTHKMTISIGVASLAPDVSDASALIARADIALYHAKQQGGNTVIDYRAVLGETLSATRPLSPVLKFPLDLTSGSEQRSEMLKSVEKRLSEADFHMSNGTNQGNGTGLLQGER